MFKMNLPTLHLFKRLRVLAGLIVFVGTACRVDGQTLSDLIPVTDYGYLDQYNLNEANNFVGDEACVPTSSTNALTYLQNVNPGVFGMSLTGTTYASWEATDQNLINILGTTAGSNGGTYDYRIPYGIDQYVSSISPSYASEIKLSGQFKDTGWTVEYPRPEDIKNKIPEPTFFYDALMKNSAVIMGISYSTSNGTNDNDGGHELLVNGITWNATTETGTIYFIDPLNPSEDYTNLASDGLTYQPDGPAMETVGQISLLDDGSGAPGYLLLSYDQYEGDDLHAHDQSDPDFETIFATIDSVLEIAVVPEPSQYGGFIFLAVAGALGWRRLPGRTFRATTQRSLRLVR
jgi:hypothetical protein